MLTVDASKRITLKEIRRHPWFRVALPPYLSSAACLRAKQSLSVDPEIIQEMTHVSLSYLCFQYTLYCSSVMLWTSSPLLSSPQRDLLLQGPQWLISCYQTRNQCRRVLILRALLVLLHLLSLVRCRSAWFQLQQSLATKQRRSIGRRRALGMLAPCQWYAYLMLRTCSCCATPYGGIIALRHHPSM